MNEKECKRMRKYAKSFINHNKMDMGTFRHVYRAIKKGATNESKLARLMATPNQPMEHPKSMVKERDNDTNN